MLAITPIAATPDWSEQPGLAEMARLRAVVESENACALPGCSIKYNSFLTVMWRAVQRGFVSQPDAVFTADGLRHGFSLGVDVTKMRGHRRYSNYKSAVDAAVSVSRAIGKRVETGKTLDLGPWSGTLETALCAMFDSTIIFPMGAVGKSVVEYEDEKRPTDDHSRTGLNAATDMAGLSYSLDTYREVAHYLKQGYFMRVSDVASAFPILPLRPVVWPYFLFRFFRGSSSSAVNLFAHIFADFGASGTPGTFKKFFVDVVVNMARSELVLTLPMPIFVDDCGLIGCDDAQVDAEMVAFHQFCDVVCGVFFKFLKDRAAAQKQLMIGFWWDSRTLTRTLDEVKLLSYMTTLADYAARPTLTLREMQSIAGKMQRATMTFPRGAACLVMSMFALTVGLTLPWHRRRVTKAARGDMWTIWELLHLNLGKGFYSYTNFLWGPEVATDASRSKSYTGGGFICRDGVYDFWRYGSRASRKLIDFLEGDTVVETVRRMASRWRGCMVKFYIDNMVFEQSGKKGRSKKERLNVLLKELFMAQILYGFVIIWEWLDTKANCLSDHLSRGREDGFLRDAHLEGWWNLPAGVVPRRLEGAGRVRQLPEVRGQISSRMLQEVRQRVEAEAESEAAQQVLVDRLTAGSNTPSNPPPVAPGRGRGGGLHVRRGGSLLLGLVFFALCATGESARGEGAGAVSAFAGASYTPASIFDGLPVDLVGTVEQIIDNRLASSSWRKVDASLKYWRPFAVAQGWPTIIASGDPLRGGKLAGFVTMLVLTTALVYASITKYVWGLCEWMKLQHQDDPRGGVRGWVNFMKSIKVLTFQPGKPHDRFPVELVTKLLRMVDRAVFGEVQSGFFWLLCLYTFSRTESPLPKSLSGRESWSVAEHMAWGDVKLVRDGLTGRRYLKVRFKKTKTDQRVERPEAAGDGDWAVVGGVEDPLFDLCEWYLLLCSFYPPPMRRDDEPFFLNPRLFPEGTRGVAAAAKVRDATGAWTYSMALTASYAMQRLVGVIQGEELGFHGLRVEGYNLSKLGNGEDITVAHGLWKSNAHTRYQRFKMAQIIDIPRRMLRSIDEGASSEDGDSSGVEEDVEEAEERVARPPAERLRREQLAGSALGAASSGAEASGARTSGAAAAGASLLPAGWRTESRMPASGTAYSVHFGPQGQRASTRPEAWRIADREAQAEQVASPSSSSSAGSQRGSLSRQGVLPAPDRQARSQPAASGPVPVGVELEQHQTWQERPSGRSAPTVRNRR